MNIRSCSFPPGRTCVSSFDSSPRPVVSCLDCSSRTRAASASIASRTLLAVFSCAFDIDAPGRRFISSPTSDIRRSGSFSSSPATSSSWRTKSGPSVASDAKSRSAPSPTRSRIFAILGSSSVAVTRGKTIGGSIPKAR